MQLNLNPTKLGIDPICLGAYESGFLADGGCGAELTEKVLGAWDGTEEPFMVTCDCGRQYRFALSIRIETESEYVTT